MKKIPTLFVRDWQGNKTLVTPEPNPECAWVFTGEGTATRKWDGTSCLIQGGRLYKRYELKPNKIAPAGFVAAQEADAETGKQPGWVLVGDGPDDAYHRIAASGYKQEGLWPLPDGTYELLGPRVQGNPDAFAGYVLEPHGGWALPDAPRDYDGLLAYLRANPMEGIVWHHPDGRMGKIKRRDFGLLWPVQETV